METHIKNQIQALIDGPYGEKFDISFNNDGDGIYIHEPQFIGIRGIEKIDNCESFVGIWIRSGVVTLYVESGTTHTTIY